MTSTTHCAVHPYCQIETRSRWDCDARHGHRRSKWDGWKPKHGPNMSPMFMLSGNEMGGCVAAGTEERIGGEGRKIFSRAFSSFISAGRLPRRTTTFESLGILFRDSHETATTEERKTNCFLNSPTTKREREREHSFLFHPIAYFASLLCAIAHFVSGCGVGVTTKGNCPFRRFHTSYTLVFH